MPWEFQWSGKGWSLRAEQGAEAPPTPGSLEECSEGRMMSLVLPLPSFTWESLPWLCSWGEPIEEEEGEQKEEEGGGGRRAEILALSRA